MWKERKNIEKDEGGETVAGSRFKRSVLEIK